MTFLRWLHMTTKRVSALTSTPTWFVGSLVGAMCDKRSHSLLTAFFMAPKLLETFMLGMEKRQIFDKAFMNKVIVPIT